MESNVYDDYNSYTKYKMCIAMWLARGTVGLLLNIHSRQPEV